MFKHAPARMGWVTNLPCTGLGTTPWQENLIKSILSISHLEYHHLRERGLVSRAVPMSFLMVHVALSDVPPDGKKGSTPFSPHDAQFVSVALVAFVGPLGG